MKGRLVTALIIVAALACPPGASATFPGANGKIAFLKSGSDCLQLVNPDGTGQTQPGACNIGASDGFTPRNAAISPDGKRVLTPVYNVANDVYDRRNSKLDGTDAAVIPGFSYYLPLVGWSQDGKRISSVSWYTCAELCGELHVALADGTGTERYLDDATPGVPVSWGSNGRIAYEFPQTASSFQIHTSAPDGSPSFLHAGTAPDWSPGADRIVFGLNGIAVVNADGSGFHNLTTDATDSRPKWSPDGQQILFSSRRDGNDEIYVMNTDGSGQTNLTNNPAADFHAIWSPDSRKIALESNRDGATHVYVMNRDGSGIVRVANDPGGDSLADWQPILPGYARPRGASPYLTYLVPAYEQCVLLGNNAHGPPLSFPSCSPPQQVSMFLTVGTSDSNGQRNTSIGSVKFVAKADNPSTPADEADVAVQISITDVRNKSDLSDYAGEVQEAAMWRITDRYNGASQSESATVSDIPVYANVPCALTADATVGSTCAVSTSVNALIAPGAIRGRQRMNVQLGRVTVNDGGSDGSASTTLDNTLFLVQGIFIP